MEWDPEPHARVIDPVRESQEVFCVLGDVCFRHFKVLYHKMGFPFSAFIPWEPCGLSARFIRATSLSFLAVEFRFLGPALTHSGFTCGSVIVAFFTMRVGSDQGSQGRHGFPNEHGSRVGHQERNAGFDYLVALTGTDLMGRQTRSESARQEISCTHLR